MRFLWLGLCASLYLSGCVVLIQPAPTPTPAVAATPPPAPSVDTRVVLTVPVFQQGDEDPPPTPVVQRTIAPVPNEACERFQWPYRDRPPPKPELTESDYEDSERLANILLDHAYDLRAYMSSGYQLLKEQYEQYLERCGYVDEGHTLPSTLYPSLP